MQVLANGVMLATGVFDDVEESSKNNENGLRKDLPLP